MSRSFLRWGREDEDQDEAPPSPTLPLCRIINPSPSPQPPPPNPHPRQGSAKDQPLATVLTRASVLCNERGAHGFFYQQHANGHEIIGFYRLGLG